MSKKYAIYNHMTGLQEEVLTWEEAKQTQERIRTDYIASIESLFAITVLIENADSSWTQSAVDENGDPYIIADYVDQNTA